jgi:hypothetical protein
MEDEADMKLLSAVNLVGVAIMSLLVVYHFATATEADAKEPAGILEAMPAASD